MNEVVVREGISAKAKSFKAREVREIELDGVNINAICGTIE